MYKQNIDPFSPVLKKIMLYIIITQEQKIMFRGSLGTLFSTASARIWIALIVKFNVDVPFSKFKISLKLYLR